MDREEKQNQVLIKQYQEIKKYQMHMIKLLLNIVIERHVESGQHIARVELYSRILASHYAKLYPKAGLTKRRINLIAEASKMHDIGKLTMSDTLLRKSGHFCEQELSDLMEHTVRGSEIMSMFVGVWDDEYSQIGYNICKYHHARYDGSGYPQGIQGDQIPLEAQIVSLADMYDVLVNEPINNHIHSKEEAYRMLIDGECGVLAPAMKECLDAARKELEEV